MRQTTNKNLLDYLQQYSDIKFSRLKFNELDAAVFAAAAYVRFERLALPTLKLKNITLKMKEDILKDVLHREFYGHVLDYLCSSARYKEVRISKIKNIFSIENTTQFCGFLFILNSFTGVIAYRGTDNTILGWKEDLEMGYKPEVPAHKEALSFFKIARSFHLLKTFYIVGHSKGGNIAEYVGSHLKEKDLNRINGIYNFDGPGFLNENGGEDLYIFHKIVPTETVVGILLNKRPYNIINAEGRLFSQHNLESWEVDLDNICFKRVNERTKSSILFEETFNEWFATLKPEDVENTIEAAIITLDKKEDTRISDLEVSVRKILANFLKTRNIAASVKKRIVANIISLWKIYRSKRKEILALNVDKDEVKKTKKRKGGKKNGVRRAKRASKKSK